MSAEETRSMSVARAAALNTVLSGCWLAAARIAWVAIAMLTLGLTTAGFVVSLRNWEYIGSQSIYLAITSAGIPVTLVTVLGLLLPHVVFTATAIIIFIRRSRDWPPMFFALALMTFTAFRPLLALERAAPASSPAVDAVLILGIFLGFTLLLLFPNGHFVPSWTRFLMLPAIPVAVMLSEPMRVVLMMPDQPSADAAGALRGAVAAMLVYIGIGIGAQIYRFRTASNVVERQQIKLVGFAIGTLLGTLLLGFAVPALFIDISNAWFAWGMLATVPMFLLVPGLVAIAILRYQLFAIDHIISRTVAYAALTLVLAVVYTSTVVVLGPILGGNSQASVAGATLAVAVAARPAQRRLQDVVDRHFNRRTYDVRRTIKQFGRRLQGELDVTQVERELLGIVHGTLQPKAVSLWRAPLAAGRQRSRS